MTLALDSQLRVLAERELELLHCRPPALGDPMVELQQLEAQAQALFLLRDRDVAEVRHLLADYSRSWLAFIHTEEPMALWADSHRPHASEHLMVLCDLLVNGLLEALASERKAVVPEFRSRFLERIQPENELSEATMILARQLCLLSNREFARAADELDSSWDEWVEFNLIHPQDELWNGLRGVVKNDAHLVNASLHGMANKRIATLRYAVESGLLLRNLPARLTLQMSSGALWRLAQSRGISLSLDTEALLTRRAAMLWRLG